MRCRRSEEGFISVYYLALLLWVTLAAGAVLAIISDKAETMINLQSHEEYLIAETYVIHDIRCRLENGEAEEGSFLCGPYSYDMHVSGNVIYVQIGGEFCESLEIEYDKESGMLTDYAVYR